MTTYSNPYPDFQECQPSPSPNLLSSDEEDNTRIENDALVVETEQNCIPESDNRDNCEFRGRLSQSGKVGLEEKPDIHESIKELKTLIHAVCAKVEKNEESLKMLYVQYKER